MNDLDKNQYQISNLSKNPEFFGQVVELVEKEFGYEEGFHFKEDFYLLIREENWKNCHFIYDIANKKLITHIGTLDHQLTINNKNFKVCCLGGIATSRKFQKLGFNKALMNHVLELNFTTSTLYLLWSSQIEYYKKFNFSPAGAILEFGEESPKFLKELHGAGFKYAKLKTINETQFEQIKKLYEVTYSKCLKPKRDDVEWNLLKNIVSADLYILEEAGKIVCYFFYGKGQDLNQIIYEYGYNEFTPKISRVFKKALVWAPDIHVENFPVAHYKYLGLWKTGNPKLFIDFVSSLSENKISNIQLKENQIEFMFENTTHQYDLQEFLELILGPNPAEEFKSFYKSLYFSGLESI